jgi:hypothetical protein
MVIKTSAESDDSRPISFSNLFKENCFKDKIEKKSSKESKPWSKNDDEEVEDEKEELRVRELEAEEQIRRSSCLFRMRLVDNKRFAKYSNSKKWSLREESEHKGVDGGVGWEEEGEEERDFTPPRGEAGTGEENEDEGEDGEG